MGMGAGSDPVTVVARFDEGIQMTATTSDGRYLYAVGGYERNGNSLSDRIDPLDGTVTTVARLGNGHDGHPYTADAGAPHGHVVADFDARWTNTAPPTPVQRVYTAVDYMGSAEEFR